MSDESAPQVWINPGIYSYHFDRSRNFRENNIGVGVEVVVAKDHDLMAGTFINSDRQRSRFAGYQWRPLHWQLTESVDVHGGITIAVLDV